MTIIKTYIKIIIIKLLIWEAGITLARHKPTIVAITGSLGKTGTKDAVAVALSAKYSVRKSPKSFNSEFGVPLTILGLPNAWGSPIGWLKNLIKGFFIALFGRGYEDVLVLEVGADKPGDIKELASWIKADVVIVTAVPEVPVHMEFYPTAQDVLKEKGELISTLKSGGLLLTGTDEQVKTLENPNGATKRITYDSADIMYSSDGKPVGMKFIVGGNVIKALGILGEHQGYAIAFALAVAEHLDVDANKATVSLESMERTPGRMRILDGKDGSIIIDDSYNSSPTALKAALETLSKLNIKGKKIAILGDMRELGEVSDKEHRRAGVQVAGIVDELFAVGPQASTLADSAIANGLSKERVHKYEAVGGGELAGKDVLKILSDGDIVLVKASQGKLRLEKAVKELMLHPGQASSMLVRQEQEWLKR